MVKSKKLTTIQAYQKEAEYLNSICKKGEHNRDKLEEVFGVYKKCKKK